MSKSFFINQHLRWAVIILGTELSCYGTAYSAVDILSHALIESLPAKMVTHFHLLRRFLQYLLIFSFLDIMLWLLRLPTTSAGLTVVANVAIATAPRFWGPRGSLCEISSLLYARVYIRTRCPR